MMSFTFLWPRLFLLIPLPFIVRFILPSKQAEQKSALRVPFFNQLKNIGSTKAKTAKRGKISAFLLLFLSWCLLVTAAARPRFVGELQEIPAKGRSLMLALDISGSMKLTDFKEHGIAKTRLDVVSNVANDFIKKRKGDRVGLILFGTKAYLQAPLTFDLKTVSTFLNEAEIGLAGENTAIGDAIGLGIKYLRKQKDGDKVLILLSDGANTAGNIMPRQAAELARKSDVKIYTVGVGADAITVLTIFGRQKVNPSKDLDEAALRDIASMTGGKFFRAKNTDQLENIYQEINDLEPATGKSVYLRPVKELYHLPLTASTLLALLFVFIFLKPKNKMGAES